MNTIPHHVMGNATRLKDDTALIHRVGEEWETITWGEYGAAVSTAAKALIAWGIEAGDRLAILSYNTPEWVTISVAAMAVGAVPVGFYYTSSADEIADLLERSGSRIIVCQSAAHVEKVVGTDHRALELIICVNDETPQSVSLATFLDSAQSVDVSALAERMDAIDSHDPGTLIFTAAGYGHPMGVVLTHDNLVFAAQSSVELFDVAQSDSALSYLPLSHIAEQIFTILAPALTGYPVAFASSLGRVRVALPEIQPTIFFGVPLVWTGFASALRKQIDGLSGMNAVVARSAMRICRANIDTRNAGRTLSIYQRASGALARKLFADRVKQAMGFARLRLAFSGAASPGAEMLEYFASVDVLIRDVYGLSEATGPSSITREGATRFGTVGHPMPGVEISVADDEEILIKGRSVFHGYLDDEDSTAQAIRDGWLHTGDLGTTDGDGMLTITGRKKDIVVTSGGKNVDPGAIEPLLEQDEAIIDAVVIGDGYDQLGVLISVDDTFGGDSDAALRHAQAVVKRVNQRFARAEQIRRVGLLPRPLSNARGERLASGRVRRSAVIDHFADEVDRLYR